MVADNPMKDQPLTGISYKVNVDASAVLSTPEQTYAANEQYLQDASGPLACNGGDVIGMYTAMMFHMKFSHCF